MSKHIQQVLRFTILFGFFFGLTVVFCSSQISVQNVFPITLDQYESVEKIGSITALKDILLSRIHTSSFNLFATIIFLCAVIHTFFAPKISILSKNLERKHLLDAKIINGKQSVSLSAEILHFLGEVEAIFGIWSIPLIIGIALTFGTGSVTHYFNDVVNFTEPVFVVVIMAIASTRPVLKFAEFLLKLVAKTGKCSVSAWWLVILILAPLFGSFITEPAAMTIAAMLLAKQFYSFSPSPKLCYATIGLLFVNISIGGTLTHFAAPPILMVAGKWNWSMIEVFNKFGSHALISIIINTLLYFIIFRKEFKYLQKTIDSSDIKPNKLVLESTVPLWITVTHLLFLVWTVVNLHSPALIIGGLLFFIAFTKSTSHHQYEVSIKSPLLVGFFLAGLVIHGGLQQWWIAPVLSSLNEATLFIGSAVLTAFNDNASITYLASLVPDFMHNPILQKAVVAGAVTGGGLTIIANAPNPAGQSVLSKFFPHGISPISLLLYAIGPTIIAGLVFNLF